MSNNFANVLDDYFFDFKRIEIMKTLQKSNPDIPFDITNWNELKVKMESRMSLASAANLIPHLDKILAPTFKEVFENIIEIIARVYKKKTV